MQRTKQIWSALAERSDDSALAEGALRAGTNKVRSQSGVALRFATALQIGLTRSHRDSAVASFTGFKNNLRLNLNRIF
jgi:hypothetical protein